MKKDRFIGFKMTKSEDDRIRAKAQSSGLTVSEYVRLAALDKKIIRIDGLSELLPEMKRIGNNLNQATVILRTRNVQNMDFQEMKGDFKTLLQVVNSTLQRGYDDGDYQNGQRKVG